MNSNPFCISSRKFEVALPMISNRKLGLKGSFISRKIYGVIESRKNFYISLCSSRLNSPEKNLISLETIRTSMSKARLITINPPNPKPKKPQNSLKFHKRHTSLLEIKAKGEILQPNRIKNNKKFKIL